MSNPTEIRNLQDRIRTFLRSKNDTSINSTYLFIVIRLCDEFGIVPINTCLSQGHKTFINMSINTIRHISTIRKALSTTEYCFVACRSSIAKVHRFQFLRRGLLPYFSVKSSAIAIVSRILRPVVFTRILYPCDSQNKTTSIRPCAKSDCLLT